MKSITTRYVMLGLCLVAIAANMVAVFMIGFDAAQPLYGTLVLMAAIVLVTVLNIRELRKLKKANS